MVAVRIRLLSATIRPFASKILPRSGRSRIVRVRTEGAAVLLVEQNVVKALEVADRAYVLEQGRIVSHGLPDDLMKQPHIREAYLGV